MLPVRLFQINIKSKLFNFFTWISLYDIGFFFVIWIDLYETVFFSQ